MERPGKHWADPPRGEDQRGREEREPGSPSTGGTRLFFTGPRGERKHAGSARREGRGARGFGTRGRGGHAPPFYGPREPRRGG